MIPDSGAPPALPPDDSYYQAPSHEETLHYENWMATAVARIWKIIWTIGGCGAIVLMVWRGWTWSAGWLLGTAVSALNFRWLKQLADSLGGEAAKPRKAVFLGFRYVILGGGAYVILKYSAISLPAALSGLFVSVAAVILEILIELAYAPRNGTVHH